jgi:hypothetical protein
MCAANRWLILVPVLIGVSCWAQDDPAQKPVCNAENHGMLWPAHISGHDHGPIEMCSVHLWKFKWHQLTVDVSDLVKGAKPRQSSSTSASASTPTSAPPPLSVEPAPDVEQSSVGIIPEPPRH